MHNKKVVDLRRKVKRLGIKGFSRLRKQKLIVRIRTTRRRNILDEEIPEIDSPVLRPTRYGKKPQPPKETDRKKEIRELEEMLSLRSSKKRASAPALPEIKITDPMEKERKVKINRIKEINRQSRLQFRITQTASALRGFARQFRVSPLLSSVAEPREFMQMVRPEFLNLMRENDRTRMILALNSEMMRQELFSQESEILEAHFGINPIENLESSDESVQYNDMIRNIEERIQNFKRPGSNWRFQRVFPLNVHFSDYLPLRESSYMNFLKNSKTRKW